MNDFPVSAEAVSAISIADAEVSKATYVVCRECGRRERSDGSVYVDDAMVKAGMDGVDKNGDQELMRFLSEDDVRAILASALSVNSAGGKKKLAKQVVAM